MNSSNEKIKEIGDTLLQITLDHKMHERFYTRRDLEWAAQIRYESDRLQTLAERLGQVQEKLNNEKTYSGGFSKETHLDNMFRVINESATLPYGAVYFDNCGESTGLTEIRETLKQIKNTLYATAQMLSRYMENHLAEEIYILIQAEINMLDTAIWRSRVTAGLYCVAAYYRMAAEMIAMGLTSLSKVDITGAQLLNKINCHNSIMLIKSSVSFLHIAATFMGMAGTEVGCDEDRWRHLQETLSSSQML